MPGKLKDSRNNLNIARIQKRCVFTPLNLLLMLCQYPQRGQIIFNSLYPPPNFTHRKWTPHVPLWVREEASLSAFFACFHLVKAFIYISTQRLLAYLFASRTIPMLLSFHTTAMKTLLSSPLPYGFFVRTIHLYAQTPATFLQKRAPLRWDFVQMK